MGSMSEINPADARREAEARARSPRARALGGVFRVVVWIAFGFALANVAVFPVTTLYLPEDAWPPNSVPELLWLFFVSLLVGILVGIASARAVLTAVSIAIGLAAGAFVFWPAPAVLGEFSPEDPWGAGSWIAWSARFWAPLVGLTVAVVIFVVGRRMRRSHDASEALRTAVVQSGMSAPGTVTEVLNTGVSIHNRPVAHFTVAFTDHLGADRWVERDAVFDAMQVPRAGDAATVWFTPEALADPKTIAIRLDALGELY